MTATYTPTPTPLGPKDLSGLLVGAQIDGWLLEAEHVKGHSRNTILAHRGHVTDVFTTVAKDHKLPYDQLDLHTVSRDDLIKAIAYYHTCGDRRYTDTKPRTRAASSVQRRVAALHSFYSWLVTTDKIQSNPAATITTPKVSRRLPTTVDVDTVKRLYASCDDVSWPSRDRLILGFAAGCGMRLSEITSVKIQDVSLNGMAGVKIVGKGDKERWIPLSKGLVKAYTTYLLTRQARLVELAVPDPGWLFLRSRPGKGASGDVLRLGSAGAGDVVKAAFARVGIVEEGVGCHSLRHSFATSALNSGEFNLRQLQALLGHADLSTLQIYTHVDQEDLAQACETHPLADLS